MTEINYEKYTIQELYEAQSSINKEMYPENYNRLMAEINKRKQSEKINDKEFLKDESKFVKPLKKQNIKQQEKPKELSEEKIEIFKYIAYILLLNSFLILIQIVFLNELKLKTYIPPMIIDIIFAILLFKNPTRLLGNILAFRTIFGLLIHSFRLYNLENYFHLIYHIVFCFILLYLIYGIPKKIIRNIIVGFTIALQITFVASTFSSIILARNLNSLYSLSESSSSIIEGVFYEYQLELGSENWFLRDRDSALKDNPIVDQWAVNQEYDDHILIIGETLTQGNSMDYFSLKEIVIENMKQGSLSFKYINEYTTNNDNHSGLILHTKANVALIDVEYLNGLYIIGDRIFQIVTFCKIKDFDKFKNIFTNVINSFKYTGEYKIINNKIIS